MYSVKPMSFIRFNPHIYLDYFLIKGEKNYTTQNWRSCRRRVKILNILFYLDNDSAVDLINTLGVYIGKHRQVINR